MSMRLMLVLVSVGFVSTAIAAEPIVTVGAGGYASARPASAKGPQAKVFATEAVTGKMPTNDWWSSVAWLPLSERQYPHPLAVESVARGLRVFYPGSNITANKDAIFGFMPGGGGDDFILGHTQVAEFTEARVHGWSDWFVQVRMGDAQRNMTLSYGHGSPYVFAKYAGGAPKLMFTKAPEVFSGDEKSAVIGITLGKKHYALFAPSGATWSGIGKTELTCQTDKDFFALAVLPDNEPETLQLFQKYAYNHVVDTQVAWKYDEKTSELTTTFHVKTAAQEGKPASGTLQALYPHQWRYADAKFLDAGYDSVRGRMKLVEGETFTTTYRFAGVLPALPKTTGTDAALLRELLQAEVAAPLPPLKDTYWEGKWLGRTSSLIPIAEQFGEQKVADELRSRVKGRLEKWLAAKPKQDAGIFAYDDTWGTLIGYPASYGSDVELNDHHFHYGYYIRAAAEIARHDPAWATQERWGGMIDLLIRDTASPRRDDPLFPFLRNFDPYAGHSWASGHAKFGDGNNNESSSEAMNAWYGMIQWGEFTNNKELRDLGIYLYATEMQAIHEYWFDVHDENHPPGFTPSVVTMVWGGKGANATWFTANPEAVHGINWLPVTGGSLYLGHDPRYVRKNYEALVQENGGAQWDEWADVVWMYQALYDAPGALKAFEADYQSAKLEGGNSLPNTYHWISTLGALGTSNGSITADATLVAVFDRGKVRTYAAYNHDAQPRTVTFSDGFKLTVPAKDFATKAHAK